MHKVTVKVPASTTNLGPGFDCLGLALKLYNTVEMERTEEKDITIKISGEGEKELPRDELNIILSAIKLVFDKAGEKLCGLRIRQVNQIPIGRGLGSSAAARLAGIMAANELLKANLSEGEILRLAAELEGHPDNVAASLFGGLVIVGREGKDFRWLRLEVPENLKVVVAIPEKRLSTQRARDILPEKISLSDAVFNLSRVAMLVSSLISGRWQYLAISTQDRLHQPYRSSLVPGMEEVFEAALKEGARGAFLSGAGSTVAALADENEKRIGKAMQEAFLKKGLKSRVKVLEIDKKGAQVS
ncbi:homoserine kinase [Candidatus Aerophobetes bacterium]|nr:homoserine kinase [Candidatus Aerophobetes bacterium]